MHTLPSQVSFLNSISMQSSTPSYSNSPTSTPSYPYTYDADFDLSITIRKGVRAYTKHPISNFIPYISFL